MSEFFLNSMISSKGRIVERLNLLYKIRVKQHSWKGIFNRKYNKRLKNLEDKLIKHNKLMFSKKYPDCPKMSYIQINGGWLFIPYKWAEDHNFKLYLR